MDRLRPSSLLLLSFLIAALAALSACREYTSRNQSEAPLRTGDRERTLRVDNRERSYILHVPPGYRGDDPVPLVIVLHGGGGNAASAIRMTKMNALADQEHFLVVYPNGTGRLPDRVLTWNAGNCCGYAMSHRVDDVAFIRALINTLASDFNIDRNRVYATGMSNGAMMAYLSGCELADQLAAIAAVAGAMNVEDCRPTYPLSVIVFHGTADEHVRYEGGISSEQIGNQNRVDTAVSEAISFWVQHNGCAHSSQQELTGTVIREAYTEACLANAAVVLYTVVGGGHAWPGGEKGTTVGDEPTREISASALMWRFFERHPK